MNIANDSLERELDERLSGGPREAVRELATSTLLPRIEPRLRQALNRLHDHRAAPLAVAIGGARHGVQWLAADAPMPAHDTYRFRLGPHAGRLGLDLPALADLLGEPRPQRIPKMLRCILVAEATRECTDAISRATRLLFEWMPDDEGIDAPPPGAAQSLRFCLPEPGWQGYVSMDDPAALDELVPPLATRGVRSSAMLDRLQMPLHFALGTTRIRLAELRSIEPGDIVSIEEWQAAGAAVVVTAEVGGATGYRLVGHAEGTHITLQLATDMTMNFPQETGPAGPPGPDDGEAALDRLDALEVLLRFEVGELKLTLGELRNIRAGHVFELGLPLNRSPVRILAHGNLLGTGTLVAVGDRLGVRVGEFTSGEL